MPNLEPRRLLRAAAVGVILGALAWIAKPDSEEPTLSNQGAVTSERSASPSVVLFDPAAVAPQQAPVQAGPIVLQGLSWSGRRVRVLVAAGGAAPVWLNPGEAIGEWTFVGPTSQGAQFLAPTGLIELRPFTDSNVRGG